MAECVSCGKEIPAGKFFCNDCYVKMKGRRGPLGRAVKKHVARKAAEPDARKEAPVDTSEISEDTALAIDVAGEVERKKASGTLTPSSGKKVVALSSAVDKAAKDGVKSKKRFSVTITFSERTYAAIDRMKERLKRKKTMQPEAVPEVGNVEATPDIKRRRTRRGGPHGRPQLKAVGNASSKNANKGGYLVRVVRYRTREWDRGDLATALMATGSVIIMIALSWFEWVKVRWVAEGGFEVQVVGVKGVNLGYLVYVIMAIAAIAWLYMAVTAVRRKPPINLDPGLVLLVAGIIIVPLIFIARSSNANVYNAAVRILQGGGAGIPGNVSGYELDTAWPVFIMILMGFVLAFSGLIRLSQRRVETAEQIDSTPRGGSS